MNEKPALLVLAAGLGSRYGGLKQMEPFGPQGEALLDYAVQDAARAGFGEAVFVVSEANAEAFESLLLPRLREHLPCRLVFQRLQDLPDGRRPPEGRSKPWGTVQAVLAARHTLRRPFVMVNADDYYGPEAFSLMAQALGQGAPATHYLAGYRLDATLSEHGGVARAICECDAQGRLLRLSEHKALRRQPDGRIADAEHSYRGDEPVSMNCFGFQPSIFAQFEHSFSAFLQRHGQELKSELVVPETVDQLARTGQAQVQVLRGTGRWFGVTYPEDRPEVLQRLKELHDKGLY